MAKQKYGESFAAGIRRNMEVTGVMPPPKKQNIGWETAKLLPKEIVNTTKRWGKKILHI